MHILALNAAGALASRWWPTSARSDAGTATRRAFFTPGKDAPQTAPEMIYTEPVN